MGRRAARRVGLRHNNRLHRVRSVRSNQAMRSSAADISDDQAYRWSLWRTWPAGESTVLFVCCNPSTADGTEDDPTVRRCVAYAQAWGYRAVAIGNLYAFRTSKPRDLRAVPEPVGPLNDQALAAMVLDATIVVCAWGADPGIAGYTERVAEVTALLNTYARGLQCLGRTKDGWPRHPLYMPANAQLEVYA